MTTPHRFLTVLLLVGLALHLGVLAQGLPTLVENGYLYDDSFYAFEIARNVAGGQGPTFDGATLTNGFQPLYVALIIPFYWILGGETTVPIYAALVLLALATVATAGFIYAIVRRYAGSVGALIGAGLWLLAPIVVRQTANGLETAVAGFFLAACTWYYLTFIRARRSPGVRRRLAMGCLLGAAMLAREDLVLLALVMALDHLLALRRTGARSDGARAVGWIAGAAAVVYSPWVVYGLLSVGSPFQESGAAVRQLSIVYAPMFGMGERLYPHGGPTPGFVWNHVLHALGVLKSTPVSHVLFRGMERTGDLLGVRGTAMQIANGVGFALIAAFVVWARRKARAGSRNELSFLLAFAGAILLAYCTWIFGAFFFTRYFYPVFIVLTVFAGLAADDILARVRRFTPGPRRVIAGVAGTYGILLCVMSFNAAFRSTPIYPFYAVAEWIRENTRSDETIGVFQSGMIGYFCERQIVNLDGKVDGKARDALRAGRLDRFLVESGVDIVIDDIRVLDLFFGPWDASARRRMRSSICFRGRDVGAPMWVGYRVNENAALGEPLRPPGRSGFLPRTNP